MSAAERAGTKPAVANHNLWQIAKLGDVNELEQALARGADVNASNNLGLTPLMMAAYHGQTEMVKALVEHGADVNAVDNGGLTAAMLAEDADHAEIVRTLVARGIKRIPATPQSQATAKIESVDAIAEPEVEPTAKGPEVRTLGEPPDIWDLVHEAPTDFKASSNFAEHIFRLHPLVLAAILVVIGGSVGFFFTTLGTGTTTATVAQPTDHNAASLPVATNPNNAKTPADSNPPALEQKAPAANQEATKVSAPIKPVRHTIDVLRAFAMGVAAETLVTQPITKPEVDNEGRANHASYEGDASLDKDRSNSTRTGGTNFTLSKNKRRAAVARASDDENEASGTVLRKEPAQIPNPEPISTAKPAATPKPKVIPWP